MGVPAAVVVMQVGANDRVDIFGLEADLAKPFEEGHIEMVEEVDRVWSAVAGAGVDKYHPAIGNETQLWKTRSNRSSSSRKQGASQ
jgi:hypothetical protein